MSWSVKTYKIIKKLHPIDLFEIITRGKFPDRYERERKIVKEIYADGAYWERDGLKLDSLNLYISDTSVSLFTKVKEVEDVKKQIKELGFEPFDRWFNDGYYYVGFSYTYDDFDQAYKEWNRNKMLDEII